MKINKKKKKFTYWRLFNNRLNLHKKKKTGGKPLSWKTNALKIQLCEKYLLIKAHSVVKLYWTIAEGIRWT